MVAMLAFGGTYAYFTATASDVDATATTGILKTNGTLAITNVTKIVPNQTVDVTANLADVKIQGNTISAIRATIAITKITDGNASNTEVTNTKKDKFTLSITDAASKALGDTDCKWVKDGDYLYYLAYIDPTGDVALSTLLTKVSIKLAEDAGNDYQNLTVTFGVTFEVVQAEYNGSLGAVTESSELNLATAKALTWTTAPATGS